MIQQLSSQETFFPQTLPVWFKQRLPDAVKIKEMRAIMQQDSLSTVCQEARCPNMSQCWGKGTATFIILGDVCTRACRFCAVKSGSPLPPDLDEPRRVALTIGRMKVSYAVITSVTRDDLEDKGAGHFARTIDELHKRNPAIKVEVLIPDFGGYLENLEKVITAGPDVIGHNLETVRRLSPLVRPQGDYERSLDLLRNIKRIGPNRIVKSGLMLGLGETDTDVRETLEDLYDVGCDIVTIGQYLCPRKSSRHLPVARYVAPEEFDAFREFGLDLGLPCVVSGPLVRSSYQAQEGYAACRSLLQRKESAWD